MSDQEIEYKDISFSTNEFKKLEINGTRGPWSVATVNDMEIGDVGGQHVFKPRSLATPTNDFSSRPKRSINVKPKFDGEVAGNITIQVFDEYTFIFDLVIESEYRGAGGGEFMMDIYKGLTILLDKDWAAGFVGDGDTENFLRSQGFSRAEFEHWTNGVWDESNLSGDIVFTSNFYMIDAGNRVGLAPSPSDIQEFRGPDTIQQKLGQAWDVEAEEAVWDGDVSFIDTEIDPKMLPYNLKPRVRRDVAQPFWERGWSTWFKIKRIQIDYDDSIFPITDRAAPVLDRIKDPSGIV